MASWSEVPVFDRRKKPRCVVCDGRGCEFCPSVHTEVEALSRITIETLDPTGKGALPTCPKCVNLLRTRLPERHRICDRHGHIPDPDIYWIAYHTENPS